MHISDALAQPDQGAKRGWRYFFEHRHRRRYDDKRFGSVGQYGHGLSGSNCVGRYQTQRHSKKSAGCQSAPPARLAAYYRPTGWFKARVSVVYDQPLMTNNDEKIFSATRLFWQSFGSYRVQLIML